MQQHHLFEVGLNGELPCRKDNNAAGYDFFASQSVNIPAGQSYRVKTNVKVNIPTGCVGTFHSKFNMAFKHLVMVLGGVISPEFNEEVSIGLINMGHDMLEIRKGDAIAQLVITPCLTGA